MDVFCLAYIGLVTAGIVLLSLIIYWAIKTDKLYFSRSKVTQKRINQLKGQQWICIRYIEERNGKDYLRESEIPVADFMQLILADVENKYGKH